MNYVVKFNRNSGNSRAGATAARAGAASLRAISGQNPRPQSRTNAVRLEQLRTNQRVQARRQASRG